MFVKALHRSIFYIVLFIFPLVGESWEGEFCRLSQIGYYHKYPAPCDTGLCAGMVDTWAVSVVSTEKLGIFEQRTSSAPQVEKELGLFDDAAMNVDNWSLSELKSPVAPNEISHASLKRGISYRMLLHPTSERGGAIPTDIAPGAVKILEDLGKTIDSPLTLSEIMRFGSTEEFPLGKEFYLRQISQNTGIDVNKLRLMSQSELTSIKYNSNYSA